MKKRKILFLVVLILMLAMLSGCCLKHEWKKATCVNPKTCKECGKTEGEPRGHSWEDATCEDPETCSFCDETRGDPLDHEWEEATCETPRTCGLCGLTEGEVLDHDWKAPTCTDPGICRLCEKEGEPAQGHTWTEATCLAPKTCEICGETEGTVADHIWMEATISAPKTCQVCGKTEGSARERTLVTDIVSYVSASSTYNGDRVTHYPDQVLDGKKNTNWTEGIDGNGEGEFLEFTFRKTYLLDSICIHAGNHSDKSYYINNARPKTIVLTFSDGTTQSHTLEDSMSEQMIPLERPVETSSLRLTIESVYPGDKWEDTVISEISFVAFE